MNIAKDFRWDIADRGYTIFDGVLDPITHDFNPSFPMENEPSLFLVFSEIEATDDAILEFANQYGPLISELMDETYIWPEAIHAMKTAVNLWWTDGDSDFLYRIVEGFLSENIYPTFFKHTTPHLQFLPDTLYVALWLQLALAISNGKSFRYCAWCDAPFELSPSIARTNRIFCSNACKQAEYRERKTQVKNPKPLIGKKRTAEPNERKFEIPSNTDIKKAIKTLEKHGSYLAASKGGYKHERK